MRHDLSETPVSTLLELLSVSVSLGGRQVVSSVSLTLERGEVIALSGPSGGGKTSLGRIVLGLLAPSSGEVRLRGKAVSEREKILIPPHQRKLGAVFQDLALWPHLTVFENVEFGLRVRKTPREARRSVVAKVFDELDLADLGARRPHELSGGQMQRVALARTLVLAPDLIVFDEPLSNLDVVLKADILERLEQILRARGVGAILITHDPREASRLASRVAILENGQLTANGTASDLRASESAFARAFSAQMGNVDA